MYMMCTKPWYNARQCVFRSTLRLFHDNIWLVHEGGYLKLGTALVGTCFDEPEAKKSILNVICVKQRRQKKPKLRTLLHNIYSGSLNYARKTCKTACDCILISRKLCDVLHVSRGQCSYTKPNLSWEVWQGKLSAVSAGGSCRGRENLQCKPSADWAEFWSLWR